MHFHDNSQLVRQQGGIIHKLFLNNFANEVRQWADSNKLPIKESKSKVLTITGKRLASKINDELLVTVEDNRLVNVKRATLLGLTIDSSLSFDYHAENLCKKLASRIGVMSEIRALLSLKRRLLFYNAIIRPEMSYHFFVLFLLNLAS